MCAALFAFPGSAVAGAHRSADSLVGEQVGEAKGSRQGHQRHHVPHAGASPSLPPAPQRLVVDVETPCNLRPRQPRLLLEPLQPLREVVGDLVGHSAVVYALSRHLVGLPQGLARTLPPSVHSWSWANPLSGQDRRPRPDLPCVRPFLRFQAPRSQPLQRHAASLLGHPHLQLHGIAGRPAQAGVIQYQKVYACAR